MFDPQVPYNDLPPISTLEIDTSLLAKLAEDTRVAIEILNYAVKSLPDASILSDVLAVQEAKASSQIENIMTSNDDLYRGAMYSDFTEEAREVSLYKDAIFRGHTVLKDKGLLGISDIEEIGMTLNPNMSGFRTNLPNFSGLTRISASRQNGENKVLYTPPHGKELLQTLLLDMLEFLYDDDTYDLHPLIKIMLAHYQFESIHPFPDGNGRTGRILNLLFLCQKGYLDQPILYASSFISRNKALYYRLLQETRESKRYESFVAFMLLSFLETAEHTLRIVEGIRSMVDEYTGSRFLHKLKGQGAPLQLAVYVIFEKVYVRVADLVAVGIHRQTAAAYLDQFVDEGLLSKTRVGRDNIYKNIKLLELFDYDREETT